MRQKDPRELGLCRGADSCGAIDAVKMGTTVATNALLERKAQATALVITRARRRAAHRVPEPPQVASKLPALLYERVIEADERMGARGEIVRPLDLTSVRRDLAAARDAGIAAAIADARISARA